MNSIKFRSPQIPQCSFKGLLAKGWVSLSSSFNRLFSTACVTAWGEGAVLTANNSSSLRFHCRFGRTNCGVTTRSGADTSAIRTAPQSTGLIRTNQTAQSQRWNSSGEGSHSFGPRNIEPPSPNLIFPSHPPPITQLLRGNRRDSQVFLSKFSSTSYQLRNESAERQQQPFTGQDSREADLPKVIWFCWAQVLALHITLKLQLTQDMTSTGNIQFVYVLFLSLLSYTRGEQRTTSPTSDLLTHLIPAGVHVEEDRKTCGSREEQGVEMCLQPMITYATGNVKENWAEKNPAETFMLEIYRCSVARTSSLTGRASLQGSVRLVSYL